jgi:hypothetical protein
MSPLSKKWVHKVNEQRTFIFFIGLAATLVILSIIWQGFANRRLGFGEVADDWRLKQFLPAGAEVAPGGHMPLDTPARSTVVGYSLDNNSYLALIGPGNDGKMGIMSNLDLTAWEPMVYGTSNIYAEMLGPGASPAIVVRLNAAFEAVATGFVVIENNKLKPVYRIDGGGNQLPAVFFSGNVIEGHENFRMEDINGNGVPEVLVDGRYVVYGDGTPGYSSSIDVYAWNQGFWIYDKELSWAMLTASNIFPEPPTDTEPE